MNEKEVLIEVVEKEGTLIEPSEVIEAIQEILDSLEPGKHIELNFNDETSVKEKLG